MTTIEEAATEPGFGPDIWQRAVMSDQSTHYSADNIEQRLLAGIRAAGLNPDQRLSVEDLSPLDQFHTGGLNASIELMHAARIRHDDRVLDIGSGIGGSARLLTSAVGCRVDCVELSPDYCAGSTLLNELTELADRITVHQGSAVDLPFSDSSFDVVWMQNVGMNIANKRRLYEQISRVIRPGGRFAFQELAAGNKATTYFPLPWATSSDDQYLIVFEELLALLYQSCFVAELYEDVSAMHLSRPATNAAPYVPGQLGLAVFVDNLPEKSANARRSLEEGQVRFVRGVFRRI